MVPPKDVKREITKINKGGKAVGERKRYALVGVGSRARFFYQALASTYSKSSELVAFCDVNQGRMDYANRILA
ncbi:MAG: hypothetical protein GX977_01605, partial [Firmicutes bacterium]|nr:hypothetical protein [Bacillota bacterium]